MSSYYVVGALCLVKFTLYLSLIEASSISISASFSSVVSLDLLHFLMTKLASNALITPTDRLLAKIRLGFTIAGVPEIFQVRR